MVQRPEMAVFWSNVLENFKTKISGGSTYEYHGSHLSLFSNLSLLTGESPLNHAVDWLLFCGGMLTLVSTVQSVVFLYIGS